ncbi:MAG: hypothetical protein HQ515_04930 [Phycisphaeraceae bacterium]|nr:hypothetical protein [Phycisphaeraceae bacterium]
MQTQSAIWNEAIDDYLEADQYASIEDAAQFLGRHVASHLKDAENSNKMVVYGQNPVTVRALNAFSDVLRSQLNLTDIRVESQKPNVLPSDPNLLVCILDVPNYKRAENHTHGQGQGQGQDLTVNNSSGALRLQFENQSNMNHSVDFLEKDWLKTLSTLHNSGHTSVMVARSNSSSLNEAEARNQAMAQATLMVQNLLKKANQDYSVLDQEIRLTPQDLQANHLVVDEFSQSLRTSTARVWRHAVLLNLAPRAMQNLLQQKTRQIQRVHKTWAKELISLAGLALVVFILYIFLNAATKGYYAWSLRVIAVVMIAGIVVVLFLV